MLVLLVSLLHVSNEGNAHTLLVVPIVIVNAIRPVCIAASDCPCIEVPLTVEVCHHPLAFRPTSAAAIGTSSTSSTLGSSSRSSGDLLLVTFAFGLLLSLLAPGLVSPLPALRSPALCRPPCLPPSCCRLHPRRRTMLCPTLRPSALCRPPC